MGRLLLASALALCIGLMPALQMTAPVVHAGQTSSRSWFQPRSRAYSSRSSVRRLTYRQRCKESRSLLATFSSDQLTCGGGWTFPGLISGDCPISMCVLKVKTGNSPFGSMDF